MKKHLPITFVLEADFFQFDVGLDVKELCHGIHIHLST